MELLTTPSPAAAGRTIFLHCRQLRELELELESGLNILTFASRKNWKLMRNYGYKNPEQARNQIDLLRSDRSALRSQDIFLNFAGRRKVRVGIKKVDDVER